VSAVSGKCSDVESCAQHGWTRVAASCHPRHPRHAEPCRGFRRRRRRVGSFISAGGLSPVAEAGAQRLRGAWGADFGRCDTGGAAKATDKWPAARRHRCRRYDKPAESSACEPQRGPVAPGRSTRSSGRSTRAARAGVCERTRAATPPSPMGLPSSVSRRTPREAWPDRQGRDPSAAQSGPFQGQARQSRRRSGARRVRRRPLRRVGIPRGGIGGAGGNGGRRPAPGRLRGEGGVVERQLAQIAHAGGVGEPRRVDFHQLELVEVDANTRSPASQGQRPMTSSIDTSPGRPAR